MSTSLLEKFEELPILREKQVESIGRIRSGITRQINTLTSKEKYIEDIILALEKQRVIRDNLNVTQNIRPINDTIRQEYFAGLKHTIVNFGYRAFSLPIDYRITNTNDTDENKYDTIESIVIQPEYLSDDFLIALGYMKKEDKILAYEHKLAIKIAVIPDIKKTLRELTPLPLGSKRETGRISLIKNGNNKNFGKYIVFQEINDIEKNTDNKRRKKVRKIIPHVYEDLYSLIRGQEYAQGGLHEKIIFLRKIKDEILPSMRIRWKDSTYTQENRVQDLENLKSMLQGKISYNEKRALEDRIHKINYAHSDRDLLRLYGICNDLIKETEEKIGKNTEIYNQIQWLKDTESSERGEFEAFYKQIMRDIESINQESVDDISAETIMNTTISLPLRSKLGKLWSTLHNYMNKTQVTIGNPYHNIKQTIFEHSYNMKRSLENKKNVITDSYLRTTLSLVLKLKKIRYTILMNEIEHISKTWNRKIPSKQKNELKNKINETIESFDNIRFLPSIELTSLGQKTFGDMRDNLIRLQDSL